MKILHVISSLNQGGAEGSLARLSLADEENDHVVVSLMDEGVYGEELRSHNVPVICLGMPRGRLTVRGCRKLLRQLRSIRPDVVQTWMYHSDLVGGIAARMTGVPRIVWGIRNTIIDARQAPISTRICQKVCAVLSEFLPQAIVTCSAVAAREHIAAGYSASKMTVIPNGIDFEKFYPDERKRRQMRTAFGIGESEFLVGMVARYDAQKDHETLLQALAEFDKTAQGEWKCILAGRGLSAENLELKTMISKFGLDRAIILTGPRSDVPSLMNALDCHVLSSAYGEGFPNVVAEAMACGIPCVATDVGDSAMIIGETGWVVPAKNPRRLTQALAAAFESYRSEKWAERQTRAIERIAGNFGLVAMVERFRSVWRGSQTSDCSEGSTTLKCVA
jgi:glycosyltransferase involved in cell wall biosynthesis